MGRRTRRRKARNDWTAKIYFGGMSETEDPRVRHFDRLGDAEQWIRDEFDEPTSAAPYRSATIEGPGGEGYVLERTGEDGMAEAELVYTLEADKNLRDVLERSRQVGNIRQFERDGGEWVVAHEFRPQPPVTWGIKLPYEEMKERLLDIYPRAVRIEMIDMFPEEKVDAPLEMKKTGGRDKSSTDEMEVIKAMHKELVGGPRRMNPEEALEYLEMTRKDDVIDDMTYDNEFLARHEDYIRDNWFDLIGPVKEELHNPMGRYSSRELRDKTCESCGRRVQASNRKWLPLEPTKEHRPYDHQMLERMFDEINELVDNMAFSRDLRGRRAGDNLVSEVNSVLYDYLYDKALDELDKGNEEYARHANVIKYQVYETLKDYGALLDAYDDAMERAEERGEDFMAEEHWDTRESINGAIRGEMDDPMFPDHPY